MRHTRRAPRSLGAALACALTAAAPVCAADDPAPTPSSMVTPFVLASSNPERASEQECLAAAVYYEAGREPIEGRRAVAQVVLNRVRHPAYPKSVCNVVFQGAPRPGCQFTFACDGSLQRTPDAKGWGQAEAVAAAALDGFVPDPLNTSTHYHALYVHPAWSDRLHPTLRIGLHQFYRFARASDVPPQAVATLAVSSVGPYRPRARSAAYKGARAALPQAAAFSVWGLSVAQAEPLKNGAVSVDWRAPS